MIRAVLRGREQLAGGGHRPAAFSLAAAGLVERDGDDAVGVHRRLRVLVEPQDRAVRPDAVVDVQGAVLYIVVEVVLITKPGGEVACVAGLARIDRYEREPPRQRAGEPRAILVDGAVEDVVVDERQRPSGAAARIAAAGGGRIHLDYVLV